jgi:hypothetical protein
MMKQLFFSNPSFFLPASKQTSRWLAYGLSLMIVFLSLAMSVKGQNNALNFDGVDDYVTMGNVAALKPAAITVEAWIQPNNVTGQFNIISSGQDGVGLNGYHLNVLNGQIWFIMDDYNISITTGTIAVGNWSYCGKL